MYHILEVRKVDEKGAVLSSEFSVVDGNGNLIAGPFGNLQSAIDALDNLLKLEAEKAEAAVHRPGQGHGI